MTNDELDVMLGIRGQIGACSFKGCNKLIGPYYSKAMMQEVLKQHEAWAHLEYAGYDENGTKRKYE